MKKMIEKCGISKFVGICTSLLGIILFIITCFVKTNILGIISISIIGLGIIIASFKKMMKRSTVAFVGNAMLFAGLALLLNVFYIADTKLKTLLVIIGMVLYVVGGIIRAITSEDHRLLKALLIVASVPLIIPWLLSCGFFQDAEFVDWGYHRLGLGDIGLAYYNSIASSVQTFAKYVDKVIYLVLIGGLYGVLAKSERYQKLVGKFGSSIKAKPYLWTAIISVVLFALGSMFTQVFAVFIVIPFIYSSLLKGNFDKVTAFAVTVGSVLAGVLGATYGGEIIQDANMVLSNTSVGALDVSYALSYRFIIAAVALVLYAFFLVMRVKKVTSEAKKTTKNSVIEDDPFEVEETKSKKSVVPVVIVLALTVLFTILCFIDWNGNWKIDIFVKFHDWIKSLFVIDNVSMSGAFLGSYATALGSVSYLTLTAVVVVLASIIIAVVEKMNANEFFNSFGVGAKKATKPIFFISIIYFVYFLTYWAPFVPVLANYLLNLTEGFNLWYTSAVSVIASMFTDSAFISMYVMAFLNSVVQDFRIVYSVFTSLTALTQIFVPTSVLLVAGLTFFKVDYKDWLKYIWLFVVGMFIILMIFFEVITL